MSKLIIVISVNSETLALFSDSSYDEIIAQINMLYSQAAYEQVTLVIVNSSEQPLINSITHFRDQLDAKLKEIIENSEVILDTILLEDIAKNKLPRHHWQQIEAAQQPDEEKILESNNADYNILSLFFHAHYIALNHSNASDIYLLVYNNSPDTLTKIKGFFEQYPKALPNTIKQIFLIEKNDSDTPGTVNVIESLEGQCYDHWTSLQSFLGRFCSRYYSNLNNTSHLEFSQSAREILGNPQTGLARLKIQLLLEENTFPPEALLMKIIKQIINVKDIDGLLDFYTLLFDKNLTWLREDKRADSRFSRQCFTLMPYKPAHGGLTYLQTPVGKLFATIMKLLALCLTKTLLEHPEKVLDRTKIEDIEVIINTRMYGHALTQKSEIFRLYQSKNLSELIILKRKLLNDLTNWIEISTDLIE